jgi:hypothetical protein
MIKARAHNGGVRIGKTPKKLASICCPERRETKVDTLKATEANRKRGPGTREKIRSKRINLECNTHTQEINVSQQLHFSLYYFVREIFYYVLDSMKLCCR